jgi:hypothetical protein
MRFPLIAIASARSQQSGALLAPVGRAGRLIPLAVNNQLSGRTAAFKVC